MAESVRGLSDENELEDADDVDSTKKTDLMAVSGNLISNINYKVAFFLFLLGMLIFSDWFIESILSKFSGTSNGLTTTTKGTVIQLVFLVLAYVIVDLLTKYGWL